MTQALSSHIYPELPSTFTANTRLLVATPFQKWGFFVNWLQDISQQLSNGAFFHKCKL